jgi:putative membrane protein
MLYTLFRYLHFLAIFSLAGALIIKNMAIKPVIKDEDAHNLAKVNAVYSLSAVLAFVFGLVLWLWVGKPAEFYTLNPLFLLKLGLFAFIALLSVFPSLFFVRNYRVRNREIPVPRSIQMLIRIELVLLVFISITASLMARGIGLSS